MRRSSVLVVATEGTFLLLEEVSRVEVCQVRNKRSSSSMSKKDKRAGMPKQSDFTGGLVSNVACSFVGSSGEKVVDEKIMALASELVSDDRT